MRTLRTVAELRRALTNARREASRIGLVPTMGAFHEGHLSLMRRARTDCDVVVVSLFVNPTQFDQEADLLAYPRDEQRDALIAAELGIDYLFAPAPEEMYPDGFATTVSVRGALAETFEGAQRGRGHFDGVATIVTKLFSIVAPDVAYFGQKDAQQTLLIRRLVQDLNLPVEIEVCPTVRDPDGLALSSRNGRLSPEERERATAIPRSLTVAQSLFDDGERDATRIVAAAEAELERAQLSVDYIQIVNPTTFEPMTTVEGHALALVAARLGQTRLIDNQIL